MLFVNSVSVWRTMKVRLGSGSLALEEDARAPESVEDAWGPLQRWVPHDELEEKAVEPGESFHVEEVSGISVGILTSKTVPRLHIRVYELDA